MGNNYIYGWKILTDAGENDVKCTAMALKWFIIPITRQFIALKNIYLEYLKVEKKICFEICLQMKQHFCLSHTNGKDRHKKRWRKNLFVLKSCVIYSFHAWCWKMAKHTLNSCGMDTVRFLKYVWLFFKFLLERVKYLQIHFNVKIELILPPILLMRRELVRWNPCDHLVLECKTSKLP